MNSELDLDRRQLSDRRQEPTDPWGAMPPAGLRMRARRAAEHRRVYYADRFSVWMLAMIVTLLVACIADAAITLCLIDAGHAEFNPLMDLLLQRGVLPFLIGKYLLTAVGLPVILVLKNHYLFGTRFRVGHAIPALLAMYFVLIAYQVYLILHLGTSAG